MADEIYVAKSYEGLEKVGEPYLVKGRKYIKVRKGAIEKQVRVYTKAEYESMYAQKVDEDTTIRANQKQILGFDKGPITIFKGDPSADNDYFRINPEYRYNKFWGWYVPSGVAVPTSLPKEYQPVPLWWDEVGKGASLLSDEQVTEKIIAILHPERLKGEYQGEVGEKIVKTLTVKNVCYVEDKYGKGKIYIMEDDANNTFVWSTKSKDLDINQTYTIEGKVKSHRVYKGQKQTVLYYCKVNA